MKFQPCLVSLSAVALALSPTTAHAISLTADLTYVLQNGSVLTAILEGNVDTNNTDLFIVDSVVSSTFDGTPGLALPTVDSYAEVAGLVSSADPVLSFSGTFLDFIACSSVGGCTFEEGFLFVAGDPGASYLGGSTFNSGDFFGNAFEPFNPTNYSLELASSQPVPEPTTLSGLLIFGLEVLRRKAKQRSHSA